MDTRSPRGAMAPSPPVASLQRLIPVVSSGATVHRTPRSRTRRRPGRRRLAITSVNGGSSPTYGNSFSVVVQSQNASSSATNVTAATGFTFSVATGDGTLTGTVSGTILAGQSSATVTGVTYSKAQNGVSLTATRTSGDTLTPGTSALFNVLQRSVTLTGDSDSTTGRPPRRRRSYRCRTPSVATS